MSSGRAGATGSRTVKRDPLPSVLSTSDVAAMEVDHHLDEVEAHPGPDDPGDIAAAEIALEQAIYVGGGNAQSFVLDGDDGAVGLDARPRS